MNPLKSAIWKKTAIEAGIASAAVILTNLLAAYFFGSAMWQFAGYFFGNNMQTTLGNLLFVEGIIFLALGFVWLSGSVEARFDGSNILTNPYRRREQWKQRSDELDQQNSASKAILLTGVPVLMVGLALVFA